MKIKFNNLTTYLKKGGGIHIKESTKGSFTKYCKGKVTQECIDKAKRSGDKKLVKKAVFAENSRKWAKKHQIGGIMPQYGNQYMNQSIYTQQISPGMIPQTQQYSSMPSMYPQQGLITNTQPNVVQNTQPSALDQYKQSIAQAAEASRAYNNKEQAKKEAAEAAREKRNKEAGSLGSGIGNIVGKIGIGALNNALLKKYGSDGQDDSSDLPPETQSQIDESIQNTTKLNLQGATDFNKQFTQDVQNDFAAFRLPPIKAEKGKSLLKVK